MVYKFIIWSSEEENKKNTSVKYGDLQILATLVELTPAVVRNYNLPQHPFPVYFFWEGESWSGHHCRSRSIFEKHMKFFDILKEYQ